MKTITGDTSTNSPKEEKIFFPGLNALRFFAALGVILTHVELLKGAFGFKHYWNLPFFFELGGLGVYFFFVLSGFLITYLLLKEKERLGTIKIKDFYLRRILRIWPLYYLLCFLGFFILPNFEAIQIPYLEKDFHEHFVTNLFLYLFILPNLAFSLFSAVPHIGQAWSIGVEEQFYIVWPWIISKSKNIFKTLVRIIFCIMLIKLIILLLGSIYGKENWYRVIKNIVAMSKFECMAIGGIGAHYLFEKNKTILNLISNTKVLVLSLFLIVFLIFFTPEKIQDGIHLIYSLLFLIILLYVAMRIKQEHFLENRVFAYLGKISYGIYMYHFMIIPFVLFSYNYFEFQLTEWTFNAYVYVLSISFTILVSGLSYTVFEKRFILLKKKYTLIDSGNSTLKNG